MAETPYWKIPEVAEFIEQHAADVFPKIKSSAFGMVFTDDGTPDPRAAMEVGFFAFLDKPMIGIILPGTKVSKKMALIVDAWVEWSDDQHELAKRVADAIRRIAPDGVD